jgi:subtilisin family serine protease
MLNRILILLLTAVTAVVLFSADGLADPLSGPQTEVVVTLKAPALAQFGRSLQSASHATYERQLLAAQAATVARVESAVPGAVVRWRYHLVLDGFAVALPKASLGVLARVPGVAKVWPNVVYHSLRTQDGVTQIGADQLWGPTLATAGQGMKIGFIDDGVDAAHPYFDPTGYSYPPGFPKGDVAAATPKVIVQRAFAPAKETWKYATAPFDPVNSFHATHVAGIAAGDHGAHAGSRVISGVAPGAWIGNYKALGVPTPGFGLDGNAAEIAAAIEAAVSDGMNVINLSIGEPEVEPSRDLVVVALDNAARAGVVPVVAAGNDHDALGDGTVTSPANAPGAISVAALDSSDHIASFSSGGPTPVSLEMKPDVSAPGVNVLSSVPPSQGTWTTLSGTSMAAPHAAGAAALLLQRHPSWTVAQVKSALVQTGVPVLGSAGTEVPTTREGGGLINLPQADNPLLFAAPTGLSFGELAPGASLSHNVTLTDAGGGAGTWTASAVVQGGAGTVSVPANVTVPGTLAVTATAGATAGDVTGFVVLTLGTQTRHIPFWFDVSAPKLAHEAHKALVKPGVYRSTTKGGASLVSTYRYPTGDRSYPGPERVYRVTLGKPVANFGVVVLSGSATPHVVFAGSEDHLAGYAGLPMDLNPYRTAYGNRTRTAGAVLPARGAYDIVFDTASTGAAGAFSFRYWVNDVTPPKLKVLRGVGHLIRISATDAGSGVDPRSIVAKVDGTQVHGLWRNGVFSIASSPGRHTVTISVADFQETKNMEDVPPVLPNTATLSTSVRVG